MIVQRRLRAKASTKSCHRPYDDVGEDKGGCLYRRGRERGSDGERELHDLAHDLAT